MLCARGVCVCERTARVRVCARGACACVSLWSRLFAPRLGGDLREQLAVRLRVRAEGVVARPARRKHRVGRSGSYADRLHDGSIIARRACVARVGRMRACEAAALGCEECSLQVLRDGGVGDGLQLAAVDRRGVARFELYGLRHVSSRAQGVWVAHRRHRRKGTQRQL